MGANITRHGRAEKTATLRRCGGGADGVPYHVLRKFDRYTGYIVEVVKQRLKTAGKHLKSSVRPEKQENGQPAGGAWLFFGETRTGQSGLLIRSLKLVARGRKLVCVLC